ncbi:MAG TPA: hypothetical protein VFX94_05435 [Burkholderiales bacterium]|nr:hypothetical protein [Burkholderiales bacterium]
MRYAVIDPAATIESASAALRACDADALLVIGARPQPASPVLSARDIVTRVVAVGLDPRVVTVSDLLRVMADRPL